MLGATSSGGRDREAQLGTTFGVDEANGLVDHLEEQRRETLEDPTEGTLLAPGAAGSSERDLEAPNQIEREHA